MSDVQDILFIFMFLHQCFVARLEVPSWVRPPKRRDGKPWVLHLPDDGVLLSPMVEVFRDGTNDGYAFRDAVTVLAAVVPPGGRSHDSPRFTRFAMCRCVGTVSRDGYIQDIT